MGFGIDSGDGGLEVMEKPRRRRKEKGSASAVVLEGASTSTSTSTGKTNGSSLQVHVLGAVVAIFVIIVAVGFLAWAMLGVYGVFHFIVKPMMMESGVITFGSEGEL